MSKNNSERLWQKILKKLKLKSESTEIVKDNNTDKGIDTIETEEHKESNVRIAMRQLAAPYKETPQYQEYQELIRKGYNVEKHPRFKNIKNVQKYENAPLVRISDKEDRDR